MSIPCCQDWLENQPSINKGNTSNKDAWLKQNTYAEYKYVDTNKEIKEQGTRLHNYVQKEWYGDTYMYKLKAKLNYKFLVR